MGISRRGFMQFCAGMASLMALPPSMVPAMAAAVLSAKPSVIYMSFQECTGCLESLVNSSVVKQANSTTIENLILNLVSLDYQETLMAAAGTQAEEWRDQVMAQNAGKFVLIVDGSIPKNANSGYFVSGGKSGVLRFVEAAQQAGLVIAMGSCASFGGLPNADPNPTGAVSIGELMKLNGINKPLINLSGCPPIAEVITGVIMYYLTYGKAPALDRLQRPRMFYGETIHDECYRKDYYEKGLFAKDFNDAGARKGYCLLHLGCKGPVTGNACSTVKWNGRTSFPMQSGHGCMGCAQPYFWDGGQTTSRANPAPFWPNGPVKSASFYSALPPGSFDD
jgi:hydrogenase small subunit